MVSKISSINSTKIDYRKSNGILILTSLLEDLVYQQQCQSGRSKKTFAPYQSQHSMLICEAPPVKTNRAEAKQELSKQEPSNAE